jgi:hypothetical protein
MRGSATLSKGRLTGGEVPMLIGESENKNAAAGRCLTLFLSLFLLLLAFFIVINAMSVFEKGRGAAVVDSVNQAFMTAIIPTRLSGAAESDPTEGTERQRLAAIGSAFETILPGAADVLHQTQDRLILTVLAEALFAGQNLQLTIASRNLIEKLVPIVEGTIAQSAIGVEVITGMLDGETPIIVGLRGQQAASLLAGLRGAGLKGRDLAIGADVAESDRFTFIFNVAERRDDD